MTGSTTGVLSDLGEHMIGVFTGDRGIPAALSMEIGAGVDRVDQGHTQDTRLVGPLVIDIALHSSMLRRSCI